MHSWSNSSRRWIHRAKLNCQSISHASLARSAQYITRGSEKASLIITKTKISKSSHILMRGISNKIRNLRAVKNQFHLSLYGLFFSDKGKTAKFMICCAYINPMRVFSFNSAIFVQKIYLPLITSKMFIFGWKTILEQLSASASTSCTKQKKGLE